MNQERVGAWNEEFAERGAGAVRRELMLGRWDADKRAAARRWLEQSDARAWQAGRAGRASPGSFMLNKRNAKWWGFAVAGLLAIVAIARLAGKFWR